jgi:hypothetical protein
MPDKPLTRDTREARRPFSDNYVVMGIVFVCVLMAVALLWAGMFDAVKSTTPPSTQAPATTQSDSQAPAITQPSTQSSGAGENKTP